MHGQEHLEKRINSTLESGAALVKAAKGSPLPAQPCRYGATSWGINRQIRRNPLETKRRGWIPHSKSREQG